MRDLAARIDELVLRSVGRAVGLDLVVTLRDRDSDVLRALSGAWLVLTVLLALALLPFAPHDSWPWSAGVATLLTVPGAMSLLRGVYDPARGRYTRGGPALVLALVVAFLGALVAVQPVG